MPADMGERMESQSLLRTQEENARKTSVWPLRRLFHSNGASTVRRVGLQKHDKYSLYRADWFHTLVNVRNTRFFGALFCIYLVHFLTFGLIYYTWSDIEDHQHDPCLRGVGNRKNFVYNFLSATCFSIQTATTLGYGDYGLAPNPTCFILNTILTAHVIISLILDYTALGLVWARISRPSQRMRTVVFSKNMTLSVVEGIPRLTFRFANARKHQILQPTVKLFLASVRAQQDKLNPAMVGDELLINELGIDNSSLSLFVGFPCTCTHTITAESPLFGLTTSEMENNGMQFLVCLEGIDSSTSNCFQARFNYIPSDILEGHCFEGAVFVRPDGGTDVDFERLNNVIPVTNEVQNIASSPSTSSLLENQPADKQTSAGDHIDAEARWKERRTVNELKEKLYESERRGKAFEQRALQAEARLRTLLSGATESEALSEGNGSQLGMRSSLETAQHEPSIHWPNIYRSGSNGSSN